MKNYKDFDSIKEEIISNPYIKTGLYIAGGIVIIWIIGKGTLLLADATKNFKKLVFEFQ